MLSRTTETMMRVPATHGTPPQTFGSATTLARQSSAGLRVFRRAMRDSLLGATAPVYRSLKPSRLPVYVEEVVGEAVPAAPRELPHGHAATGLDLRLSGVLHEPAGFGELGVDVDARALLG